MTTSEPQFFCFRFLKCFCRLKVCETSRFRTDLLVSVKAFCCFGSSGKNLLSFYLCKNTEAMRLNWARNGCWIFTAPIKRQTWAEPHKSQAKDIIIRVKQSVKTYDNKVILIQCNSSQCFNMKKKKIKPTSQELFPSEDCVHNLLSSCSKSVTKLAH